MLLQFVCVCGGGGGGRETPLWDLISFSSCTVYFYIVTCIIDVHALKDKKKKDYEMKWRYIGSAKYEMQNPVWSYMQNWTVRLHLQQDSLAPDME